MTLQILENSIFYVFLPIDVFLNLNIEITEMLGNLLQNMHFFEISKNQKIFLFLIIFIFSE